MDKISIISKNIKSLRSNLGYSQEQLAQKLDITRQTVSNWESGKSMPNATQLDELSVIFQKSADFMLNESIGNKDIKVITSRLWIILLLSNLLLTTVMLLLTYQQKGELFLKVIIPAGPPIVISIIVWSVMENALKTEDYNLIGGYNNKYNYNYVELRKIVCFIQGYTVIVSFLANFILFVLSFFQEFREKYNYVLYLYLFNLFIGIIYINVKKKNQLFI